MRRTQTSTRTSPARKMDTPQIFPSKPTPSQLAPCLCVFSTDGLERQGTFESAYGRCFDNFGHNRQLIQALFDEQTNDAVRIEDEISPRRVLVPNNRVERLQLRGSTERKHGRRNVVLYIDLGAIVRDGRRGRHDEGPTSVVRQRRREEEVPNRGCRSSQDLILYA